MFKVTLILGFIAIAYCEICVKYDFENDFEELFPKNSMLCQSFQSWEINSYSNTFIRRPNDGSTKFISPIKAQSENEWQLLNSCIKSFEFKMAAGGTVEIMFYMEAISELDILYVTANKILPGGLEVEVGLARYSMANADYTNGWHVLRLDVGGDSEQFDGFVYFLGTATKDAILVVDSFRYIGPNGVDENCIFDLDIVSQTENPLPTTNDPTTDNPPDEDPTTLLPTEISPVDEENCVTYDFEDYFDSKFSNDSAFCIDSPRWVLDSYTNVDIENPHVLSTSFIAPKKIVIENPWQTTTSCVTSFEFSMEAGGIIEVKFYMEAKLATDNLLIAAIQSIPGINDVIIDRAMFSLLSFDYKHGWNTLRLEIPSGAGEFDGHILFLGTTSEESTLIVDSLRYIGPKVYENNCLVYKDETTTTEEPTTAEPTTAELTTAEPTTEEPTTIELTTVEPTTEEPTTAQPTTVEPTTAEPTTKEPTTIEPTTVEPTTEEPTTAQPTTAEPTIAEPTTAEPTTAEPTTEEPTTAEPTTAEPTTEEPTTAEPTTVEPTTAEPTTAEQTTVEATTEELTTEEPTTAEPTTVELTTVEPTTDIPTAATNIPDDIEDCVTYDFEDGFDSKFNNYSAFCIDSPRWSLNSYININVDQPHVKSNYFIEPAKVLIEQAWQTISSCVTSFVFSMEAGGIIEVKFYIEAKLQTDNLLIAAIQSSPGINDVIIDRAMYSFLNPDYQDGWHTLRINIPSGSGQFEGHILLLGTISEDAVLIVDSFRYIGPTVDEDTCVVYTDLETTTFQTEDPTTIALATDDPTTLTPATDNPPEEEDLCVTYNFEDDFDSLFTTENDLCVAFTKRWYLGNYSSIEVNGPDARSRLFIAPEDDLSCIASFAFSMSPGGTVEVNVFMESVSSTDHIIVIAKMFVANSVDTVTGMTMYGPSGTGFTNGWNVLRFPIASLNDFNGYLVFLGAADEGSTVLVDSFRYIPPNVSEDHASCAMY